MTDHPLVTRRILLAGGTATAGMVVIAGCSSGAETAEPSTTPPETTTPSPGTSSPDAGGEPTGAAALIAVADVPVGGAASATDAEGNDVIVAQPTDGDFVAFSAVCTHQGCTVAPDGAELRCPCHGSVYDAFTGEVTGGPAPSPLPSVSVTVEGDQVVQS